MSSREQIIWNSGWHTESTRYTVAIIIWKSYWWLNFLLICIYFFTIESLLKVRRAFSQRDFHIKTFHWLRPKDSPLPYHDQGVPFWPWPSVPSLPPSWAHLSPAHRTHTHCFTCVSQQPQEKVSQVTLSPPDGTDTGGPAAPQMSGACAEGQGPKHQSPRHQAALGTPLSLGKSLL